MARGRLDERARRLPEAERRAVELWLVEGCEVEALAPSAVPGVKTADVRVDGVPWEIKTLRGAAVHTISANVRHGRKQAARVLLDIRQTNLTETQAAEGLAQAVRKYGPDLTQIRILGADFELDWTLEE